MSRYFVKQESVKKSIEEAIDFFYDRGCSHLSLHLDLDIGSIPTLDVNGDVRVIDFKEVKDE